MDQKSLVTDNVTNIYYRCAREPESARTRIAFVHQGLTECVSDRIPLFVGHT